MAIPRLFRPAPRRMFGLAPPLEAVHLPGWGAQRHRQGRRLCESRQVQSQAPPSHLSPCNAVSKRRAGRTPRLGSPYDGRHHPTNRTAAGKPRSQIARPSAAPRGGRNFVAAPPATGPSPKKNLAPRSLAARWVYFGRPQGFHLDCALAQRAKSLLRRAGDRCPGWRRLARPYGSQLSYWPTYFREPDSRNFIAAPLLRHTISVRAPGRFILFCN